MYKKTDEKNQKRFKLMAIIMIIMLLIPIISIAITEIDNGIMKVYITTRGFEISELKGFDIKGYITNDETTNEKTLISSTFGNYGYHTFLNVNGLSGEMNSELKNVENGKTWKEKAQEMQYSEVEGEGVQTINGIKMKVSTQFINNGEQLQIVYDLENTTNSQATISLATASDVQIDGDDSATIERLEDGSGVRLWTKKGHSKKPVQFVFYGKDVPGTTSIDNLWIGHWGSGAQIRNMFVDNSDVEKIENQDSAFAYSWVNKTIKAGEKQKYTVLMEVGKINIPNTGITLDNNTKFYYKDVKINGQVIDKDLKDKITVHYVVDGREYTLPTMSTTGTSKDFTLDLTSLNLSAVTPHTLKVWATDSTNCDSNTEERTFTITYLKEPEVSLSTTEWAKNVTFNITDNINEQQWVDKYQYRLNEGAWVDCSKGTDIPINENGNVKVDVRIKGTYEGDYSNILTLNAKVDKIPPTTARPTATKTTCSIAVNLGQTDEHSGIDTSKTLYAIKKDGTWSEWQDNNTFTGLTHNTEYVVKTKATDRAGNTSESEELTVKTDELLLGNLILKLNNSEGNNYTENTWTNQNIYVAIEERSIGAITKYKSKENSAQNITETNQETTVTTNDTTIITLSVTDGTNTITSDVEHILKVDKVVPVIKELVIDNEEWSKENKNITGKAIDDLSGITAYQFSKDENLTSSSNGWTSIQTTNDEMTQTKEVSENAKIYFYVKDEAGNIASAGIDTRIDSQGPVINFSRSNGKTTINVTDTGAGIKNTQYSWSTENKEPSNWQDYSSAVTYSGTDLGKIYLWAKSTDNADNTTISSSVFSTLNTPNIISEDEFINKNISFKLDSETEDTDVLYQFKINDGEWQDITKNSAHTITDITDGTVNISARILDNAGRYSKVATKTVKVSVTGNSQNNNGGLNNVDNKTQNSAKSTDKSMIAKILPKTGGFSFIVIVAIISLIFISLFLYRKIVSYKDVK